MGQSLNADEHGDSQSMIEMRRADGSLDRIKLNFAWLPLCSASDGHLMSWMQDSPCLLSCDVVYLALFHPSPINTICNSVTLFWSVT